MFASYFGIPSLDSLLGEIDQPERTFRHFATSCIVGPDGVGKSILAMHAASWFQACRPALDNPPLVIYVSTDLTFSQAKLTWNAFGLHLPVARCKTLGDVWLSMPYQKTVKNEEVHLRWLSPLEKGNGKGSAGIADVLIKKGWEKTVWFLDLSRDSAGDDWGFVNRLMTTLSNDSKIPMFMIIDAVEGLETMAGEHDSFGVKRSRRSRVAQLVRTSQACGASMLLVIEESDSSQRLPEEFIADLVIRLRAIQDGDYARRTVEVDKARAIHHIRGRHDLIIRPGRGTKTGKRPNADDPPVKLGPEPLAYVSVLHSLHARSRVSQRSGVRLPSIALGFTGERLFGLRALDELIAPPQVDSDGRSKGGSISVLVGESGNSKSRLARSFLAHAFADQRHARGAAILISTYAVEHDELLERLRLHVSDRPPRAIPGDLVWHRFIGQHYMSGNALVELVQVHIRQAQAKLFSGKWSSERDTVERRRKESWRIRLVLHDWSVLYTTHPKLEKDPLLLSPSSIYARMKVSRPCLCRRNPAAHPRRYPDAPHTNSALSMRHMSTPGLLSFTASGASPSVLMPKDEAADRR